jgi:hypothetical protein
MSRLRNYEVDSGGVVRDELRCRTVARLSVSLCRAVRTRSRSCHTAVPVDSISAWELWREAAGDQRRIHLAIPRKSNEALSGYREALREKPQA